MTQTLTARMVVDRTIANLVKCTPENSYILMTEAYYRIMQSIYDGTALDTWPEHAPKDEEDLDQVHMTLLHARKQCMSERSKHVHPTDCNYTERDLEIMKLTRMVFPDRWNWIVQIAKITPTHTQFFYPLAIFMEIVDKSKSEDVTALIDELVDECNAREMTIQMFQANVHMWLESLDAESLDEEPLRIFSCLRLHVPSQKALKSYLRAGYQAALHNTLAKMRKVISQLENPEMHDYIFRPHRGPEAFPQLLLDLIYYRTLFEPSSEDCPIGIADMVKKYMDAKLAYERGKRLT